MGGEKSMKLDITRPKDFCIIIVLCIIVGLILGQFCAYEFYLASHYPCPLDATRMCTSALRAGAKSRLRLNLGSVSFWGKPQKCNKFN